MDIWNCSAVLAKYIGKTQTYLTLGDCVNIHKTNKRLNVIKKNIVNILLDVEVEEVNKRNSLIVRLYQSRGSCVFSKIIYIPDMRINCETNKPETTKKYVEYVYDELMCEDDKYFDSFEKWENYVDEIANNYGLEFKC